MPICASPWTKGSWWLCCAASNWPRLADLCAALRLFLLRAQVFLDDAPFLCGHSRGGLLQHLHEPIHLMGRIGVADVAGLAAVARRFHGSYQHLAGAVEEDKEGQSSRGAQPLPHFIAAGSIERLLIAVLLNVEAHHHKIFIQNRFDIGGLDETIEFMAPASPGSVKDGENGALAGGLIPGGSQQFVGGTGGVSESQSRYEQQRQPGSDSHRTSFASIIAQWVSNIPARPVWRIALGEGGYNSRYEALVVCGPERRRIEIGR